MLILITIQIYFGQGENITFCGFSRNVIFLTISFFKFNFCKLKFYRGRLAVADNGRRQVYMGRGFARYEIPDHHPRLEENISALYDRRSNVGIFLI